MRKLYLYLFVAGVAVCVVGVGTSWGQSNTKWGCSENHFYSCVRIDHTTNLYTDRFNTDEGIGISFSNRGIRVRSYVPDVKVLQVLLHRKSGLTLLRSSGNDGIYDSIWTVSINTGAPSVYNFALYGGVRSFLYSPIQSDGYVSIKVVFHRAPPQTPPQPQPQPQPQPPTTNFQWFDFNMDGQIDFADFLKFAQCYGKTPEECNRE